MKKNIYIVGFMGTGKTVAGKRLAKKLTVGFIDLDENIEEKEKTTISDIFQTKGEEHFRSLEKDALVRVSGQQGFVVSCGGGTVVDPDNMALMKKTGVCVCLNASAQEIMKRIGVTTHRPLLHSGDPLDKIQSLLSSRDSCYSKADILIDTTNLSVDEIVSAIIAKIPPAIL